MHPRPPKLINRPHRPRGDRPAAPRCRRRERGAGQRSGRSGAVRGVEGTEGGWVGQQLSCSYFVACVDGLILPPLHVSTEDKSNEWIDPHRTHGLFLPPHTYNLQIHACGLDVWWHYPTKKRPRMPPSRWVHDRYWNRTHITFQAFLINPPHACTHLPNTHIYTYTQLRFRGPGQCGHEPAPRRRRRRRGERDAPDAGACVFDQPGG